MRQRVFWLFEMGVMAWSWRMLATGSGK